MTEKENAIYEFEKMATWCDKYTTEELQAINYARKMLHSFTPQPKTGHWITENMFDGDVAYRCSKCKELFWLECGTPKDNKYNFCPKCGERLIEPQEDKNKKCEDCAEWEYFDGYGHGCFCMKTMTPIDADKCEFYADKRPDIPHSWKPLEVETKESEE